MRGEGGLRGWGGGGGGVKITQQPDKEEITGLPTYHQHRGKEGGRDGGVTCRQTKGYTNFIRQSFAEVTFCIVFFLFLSAPLPSCCSRAPPQRMGADRLYRS